VKSEIMKKLYGKLKTFEKEINVNKSRDSEGHFRLYARRFLKFYKVVITLQTI